MKIKVTFGEIPTLTVGLVQMISKIVDDKVIIFEVDDEEERDMLEDEILHEVAIDITLETL